MSYDWYHRNPRDFLTETAAMSLEDSGAYAKIIDLIVLYDRLLVGDDKAIARQLGCDPRKWKAIKGRLIASKHLVEIGGNLAVPSLDAELKWRRSQYDRLRSAGHRGGIATAKARKANGLGAAHARSREEESREEEIREEGFQEGNRFRTRGRA